MSNAIYPDLPGLTWDIIKTPIFSTKIQKSVSKREIRIAYLDTPMYRWQLPYEFLRDQMAVQNPEGIYAELRQLFGFFLARRGSFDSFLFEDVTDNLATAQQFGTGDGTTRSFQLGRSFGAQFFENIENVKGTPAITIDNVATTAFALGATGIVTFTTAPALGAVLRWTGNYYFRVRFEADEADFSQDMQDVWSVAKIPLYGALQNKI